MYDKSDFTEENHELVLEKRTTYTHHRDVSISNREILMTTRNECVFWSLNTLLMMKTNKIDWLFVVVARNT